MSGVLVPQMAIEGMNSLNILRGSDGSVVTLPATIKMIVTPTEVGEEVGIIDIVETLGDERTSHASRTQKHRKCEREAETPCEQQHKRPVDREQA